MMKSTIGEKKLQTGVCAQSKKTSTHIYFHMVQLMYARLHIVVQVFVSSSFRFHSKKHNVCVAHTLEKMLTIQNI